jgi:hypothetical protein
MPKDSISSNRVATTRFTAKLRRIVDESVAYGLALEGFSAADVAHPSSET